MTKRKQDAPVRPRGVLATVQRTVREPDNEGQTVSQFTQALKDGSTPEAKQALKPLLDRYKLIIR